MKDHEDRILGNQEYENSYAEALRILREKYDFVGQPYTAQNGERACDVETLRADDLTVFMLAWGAERAHEISGGNSVMKTRKHASRRRQAPTSLPLH